MWQHYYLFTRRIKDLRSRLTSKRAPVGPAWHDYYVFEAMFTTLNEFLDALAFTPCLPFCLPFCLLASPGAEELRIGGVGLGSGDGVVGLCVHAGGLVWWLKICPSVSPRRMNSGIQAGHKGTTASRSSKQSKAECRDRVRTWASAFMLGA